MMWNSGIEQILYEFVGEVVILMESTGFIVWVMRIVKHSHWIG